MPVLMGDHADPAGARLRTLSEELARVVRARASNPKWITAMMRHGYKGAFEMAASVDYLFAFAATTHAVRDHHFDAIYDAYLGDECVHQFIADANPDALTDIAKICAKLLIADSGRPSATPSTLASGGGPGRTPEPIPAPNKEASHA